MRVGDVVRSSLELGDPNSGFSLAPNAYMLDKQYIEITQKIPIRILWMATITILSAQFLWEGEGALRSLLRENLKN